MRIALKILRYDPERAAGPRFETFEVEADPGSRLLDVLLHIQRRVDPSLAFRRSCAHGVCGSDAMVVNGKERLACKTLVRDLASADGAEGGGESGGSGGEVTIEPLRAMNVIRDLVVDERRFFDRYRAVKPYLIDGGEGEDAGEKGDGPAAQSGPDAAADPHDGAPRGSGEKGPDAPADESAGAARRESLQTPDQRKVIDEATNCILCASCFSACPVVRMVHPAFIGPAAILQAYRFQEDSRDRGFEERLEVLDHPDGVWPCESRFECTRVCPRGIKVTKHINLTKRRIQDAKGGKSV
jgi:succinate dehydrogenase / fumarate reductase iron-sulfur subunit